MRYVEMNPVRAKLVKKPEKYLWSSAAGHCGLQDDEILTSKPKWVKLFKEVPEWSKWLAESGDSEEISVLRKNIEKGLPCGAERFIKKLEGIAGRIFTSREPGRPRKK